MGRSSYMRCRCCLFRTQSIEVTKQECELVGFFSQLKLLSAGLTEARHFNFIIRVGAILPSTDLSTKIFSEFKMTLFIFAVTHEPRPRLITQVVWAWFFGNSRDLDYQDLSLQDTIVTHFSSPFSTRQPLKRIGFLLENKGIIRIQVDKVRST